MFEFRVKIPLVKNLKIQVKDYDFPPDPDDLIGETEIDLEQRLLSRYHATCGLPKTYFKYVALIVYYSKHPLIRNYFFSKGFDTINHEILRQKLQHYGIRDTALVWIKSYLEGRTQFVQFGSHRSYPRKILCGVPQSSILGPLLFIIYINDLPNVSSLTQSLLFADDTSIFRSHKDANHLVSIVNNELAKIIIWLKVNKLSLNLTKTNFMIFHPRQNKVNVNVPLTLENTVIKQVTETKFLGVLIDQHLSWKPHIDFVSKKNLEKCGNYYESPLLPIIPNFDDLVLLLCISFLNIL